MKTINNKLSSSQVNAINRILRLGIIEYVLNLQKLVRKKAGDTPFACVLHTDLIEAGGRPLILAKR
jgi:hypothetical protein